MAPAPDRRSDTVSPAPPPYVAGADADPAVWPHHHVFDTGNPAGERGTRWVIAITAAMMVVEIVAGWWFNSMALLADGWHMASHAAAIGLSAVAYAAARRLSADARFAFGTWKIEVLAGFASAVLLMGVAALMALGSTHRLIVPQRIQYAEAIPIAVVGLLVNVVCAVVLARAETEGQEDHGHHHDLNLRAASLHVAADAATSVLAVVALSAGLMAGWGWLDAVMGLVGAAVVGRWGWGLVRESARVLLDREMDHPVAVQIRKAIERGAPWSPATRVIDLHVWRVGRRRFACAVSLVTSVDGLTPADVKAALAGCEEAAHVTVEINHAAPGVATPREGAP